MNRFLSAFLVSREPKCYPVCEMASSGETGERTKLHSAIRAAAYLNKHRHALEDSILRRTIVNPAEDKPADTVAYCSSCNARTVDKCLQLLTRLRPSELQIVVKKTAEILTEESAKVDDMPSTKPGFKPSLECKRPPINTNFSYSKMKKVVNDMLQKQDRHAEVTLREAAFFNPRSSEVGSKTTREQSESNRTDVKPGNVVTIELPITPRTSTLPLPRVKVDENGQIILDPSSLTVPLADLDKTRVPPTVKWPLKDTIKFYEALRQHGTDFSMMMSMFPNRERKNLKRKFILEDKKNKELVDMVIGNNRGTLLDLQKVIQQLKIQNDLKVLSREKKS